MKICQLPIKSYFRNSVKDKGSQWFLEWSPCKLNLYSQPLSRANNILIMPGCKINCECVNMHLNET